jgi:hypothetical protein
VAQAVGETLAEFPALAPNGLIGNDNSAFSQKHLDIPQAEAEHLVQPDSTADDLGRKAMAGGGFILSLLSVFYQAAKPGYRDNVLLTAPAKVQQAADYLRSFSERLE